MSSNNIKIEEWKYELLKLLFAKKEELAFKYKQPFIPKSLFRYRKFSAENKYNIANSQEWLSNPKDFNDPFDSCFIISERQLHKSLKESVSAGKFDNDIENHTNLLDIFIKIPSASEMFLDKYLNTSYRKNKFVCCFSEQINSNVMWTHYSDNYTGFCIEYDFSISEYSDVLFPVFYKDVILSEVTNSSNSDSVANTYPILFKDSDWSYEKEWRLIYHDLLTHNSNSQLLNMPKPNGIYLGINISAENEYSIMELASSLKVPIYKMDVSFLERKLIFKILNN